jgi:hypothetical protein
MGGPDAVIEDGAVDATKCCDGGGDEGLAVFGCGKSLADGAGAFGAAALRDQGLGPLGGGLIAEDDLGTCLVEEADGGRTDSAGASGDESDFALERHDYT